jgi:hypothetical protein
MKMSKLQSETSLEKSLLSIYERHNNSYRNRILYYLELSFWKSKISFTLTIFLVFLMYLGILINNFSIMISSIGGLSINLIWTIINLED